VSLKYDDFDLQIERAGEKYRVRLLNAPTGQASGEFILPFSDVELGNFLSRIGQVRRSMRRVDAPELHAAKEFGGRLFNAVFSGEMIAQLRGSVEQSINCDHGLRIRLRLTDVPELADLPWEFLYDASQNHFLTTSTETPLVRFLDLPQRIAPLRATLPLRLLVVIAGPRNLKRLDAEGEWERLRDALSDLVSAGHLVLERLPAATLDALRLRARGAPFHIFHFIGHGGFDSIAEDGVLQFEDEFGLSYPVRGEMLGMQLHDHRSLRLAVLNACEGARSSRQDPFSGVAQSLLQQRVPAVIAMQFEISDIAAKVFAREFYRAIAEGNPVDAAVCESRKALFKEEYGQEWATPVLYMRSQEGLLFDLQPGAAVETGSGRRATAEADRQSAETAASEAAAITEKTRQELAAQQEAERQVEMTRQAQAARQAEAARQAKATHEAARTAAKKTATASARSVPETVVTPASVGHAEDLAAARVGTLSTQPAAPSTDASAARSYPSTSQISVAPASSVPVSAGQPKPRLHLPVWQVLLMAIPLAGLVLALSWHHLRGHDDGEHGGHAAQSSGTANTPGATPAVQKTADLSPATVPPATPPKIDPTAAPSAANASGSAPGKDRGKDRRDDHGNDSGKSATPAAANVRDAKLPEAKLPEAKLPEAKSLEATLPASATALEPAAKKATPAPAVQADPLRVTPSVQAAKIVSRVNPTYPMVARETNTSGEVQLRVLVAKDGAVKSVSLISGDPLLGQSAIEAVKQWRYQPTLVNGKPVEVETTVPVNYKLNAPLAAAAKPAPCTLGRVEFQDQGNPLVGSVPYSYTGSDELQSLAVRATPLSADRKPIPGLTIGQYTLRATSGTASFSVESHPSMGRTPVDGEYLLIAIVAKSSGVVVCGEMLPFQRKW
jgi:TonB family protein